MKFDMRMIVHIFVTSVLVYLLKDCLSFNRWLLEYFSLNLWS